MKRLFLTSSIDDANVAGSVFTHLGISGNPRTAFITTPIEAELHLGMKTWDGEERSALNQAGFNTFDYTITGKSLDQIQSDLSDIEVLYISGGNEFYFREMCDLSNFDSYVLQHVASGKPYIGTSCGSIMASHDISPTLKLNDLSMLKKPVNTKGFGLVSFTILPHWGSADFQADYLEKSFEQIYKTDTPLIALNNYQYVKVIGDQWQIIDVRQEV